MDIKRTVLWVVFSLSLLVLWDNWMRHTGKPSMFFPMTSQQAAATKGAGTGAGSGELPQASSSATGAAAPATGGAPIAGAPTVRGETITITTDVVKAEIDTMGGELKRLELLQHRDTIDPSKNLVLFDNSPKLTYLGEIRPDRRSVPQPQIGIRGAARPAHAGRRRTRCSWCWNRNRAASS